MEAVTPRRVGVLVASEHAGGAENYLLRLYSGLQSRNVTGVLLGRLRGWESSNRPRYDIGLGGKWSRRSIVASAVELPRARTSSLTACEMAARVEQLGLFHAQFKREQILLSPPLSRTAPVLWTEHGRFPARKWADPLKRMYARSARATSAIVCVSDGVAHDVVSICGSAVRIEVIPNSVDTQRFRPLEGREREDARERLGLDLDRPVVVVHSRLQIDKRIERALLAVSGTDCQLVVAGEGPDRDRIEGIASRIVPSARFVGFVREPEHLLGCADAAMICCSPTEGHNLASIEAAASGCQLFGFAGDPASDFIEMTGGALLEVSESIRPLIDQESLAEGGAKARLASLPYDEVAWLARHHELIESLAR